MSNPLIELAKVGQSVWYDQMERKLVTGGTLQRMIDEDDLRGLTSNPTIFDKAIAGSNVKVLAKQFGNWNRDDAFKVMQDYLTKYPKIDVVWCQDDDMAVGVLQASGQAKRTDIQYVVAGAGCEGFL